MGLYPLLIEASAQLESLNAQNPFEDGWIAVLPGVTGTQVAANIEATVSAAKVRLRRNASANQVRACKGGV